jgi:hypothetical protein
MQQTGQSYSYGGGLDSMFLLGTFTSLLELVNLQVLIWMFTFLFHVSMFVVGNVWVFSSFTCADVNPLVYWISFGYLMANYLIVLVLLGALGYGIWKALELEEREMWGISSIGMEGSSL